MKTYIDPELTQDLFAIKTKVLYNRLFLLDIIQINNINWRTEI